MQIGIVGLGRMGANIARRLMRGGQTCVVYDHAPEATQAVVADGATGSSDLGDLVKKLAAPRSVWLMLPAGKITEDTLNDLYEILEAGDTVIDGGNSFYKDDIIHAAKLKEKGINFVDVGTSGGVWGLERGYCMMIGGDKDVVQRHFRCWLPDAAIFPPRRIARVAIHAWKTAICMWGRWGRVTS
jgi:6-phosphogluconate dehydrogenase